MKQKIVVILGALVGAGLIWWALTSGNHNDSASATFASYKNNEQVIRIIARAGYNPRQISADAGKPTKLEIETKGAYDCSAALSIPALQFQKFLPPTGVTVIDVPPQPTGTKLVGTCSMGMYSFSILFN